MTSFGAFGKIPVLGDFFRTGLGNGFVSGWDDWLQRCLSEASEALADRWESSYMSAPIWRFSLAAGLVGDDAVTGVLMPSVDRVGRKFPLTLAATHEPPDNALVGHFANDGLYERLESLALDALDDAMTLDRLKERLAEIVASGTPATRNCGSGAAQVIGEGSLIPALAAALAPAVPAGSSIWTTHLDGEAGITVCDGLPEPARMAAFFDPDTALWQEVSA